MSEDQKFGEEGPPPGVTKLTNEMSDMFVGYQLADIMMALTNMTVFSCIRFSQSWPEAEQKLDNVRQSLNLIYKAYEDEGPDRYEEKGTLQ